MVKVSSKAGKQTPHTAAKSKNKTKTKKITARPFAEVDAHVREVLLELMANSGSDSVRVAAAKALMDKIKKGDDDEDGQRQQEEEYAAAIVEAQELLEAIAASKSSGADRTC